MNSLIRRHDICERSTPHAVHPKKERERRAGLHFVPFGVPIVFPSHAEETVRCRTLGADGDIFELDRFGERRKWEDGDRVTKIRMKTGMQGTDVVSCRSVRLRLCLPVQHFACVPGI